jgi:ribosomal protein S18 acetylase RimI-like enzyme
MAYPPADSAAAAQLLISLEYSGLSRLMAKSLRPVASTLPASVTARPMTVAESRDWLKRPADDFAQAWISRGMRPRPARARVRAAVQRALSDDDAANVALRLLFHGDEAVGRLWVTRPGPESSPPGAYVYEVEVEQARRGAGFGRALMLLAEEIALGWGEAAIGLQVFNDNIPARRLYESLGYVTTADVLLKDLG